MSAARTRYLHVYGTMASDATLTLQSRVAHQDTSRFSCKCVCTFRQMSQLQPQAGCWGQEVHWRRQASMDRWQRGKKTHSGQHGQWAGTSQLLSHFLYLCSYKKWPNSSISLVNQPCTRNNKVKKALPLCGLVISSDQNSLQAASAGFGQDLGFTPTNNLGSV